jgi:hypothetical protein
MSAKAKKPGIVADGYQRLFTTLKEQTLKERKATLVKGSGRDEGVAEKKTSVDDEVRQRMNELGANDYTCW